MSDAWDLVDTALAGDRNAFSELYRLHAGAVFTYTFHRTGDSALAEDITSATFMRAFTRLGTLRHRKATFSAWLFAIARNLLLDESKSARRRRERPFPAHFDTPASTGDPASVACSNIIGRNVREAITRLTADQRTCIVLRFLEDLTVEETATRMGRSNESVRSLQFRAVRRLSTMVEPELATAWPQ